MTMSSQALNALTNITANAGLYGGSVGVSQLASRLFDRAVARTVEKIEGLPAGRRNVLAAAQARTDPLMNINWIAHMPRVLMDTGSVFNLSWEYVEEASMPYIEIDQISNFRAGRNIHYPNHVSVGTLSLKFYEDSKGVATQYLTQWQRLMFDETTGLYNFPVRYKQPIRIEIYDVANMLMMVIDYGGCWPMRFDPVALGSDQVARVIMGAEFSVDTINVAIGGFSQASVPTIMSRASNATRNAITSAINGQISATISGLGSRIPALNQSLPNPFPAIQTLFG
jgi:hypothetical protein